MLNVSQDWKNAQSLQLTPESNVRIQFHLESGEYEIDKKNIESFKYIQSGSVINDSLVTKEISFDLFINENYVEIPLKTLCSVVFSYKINGVWEDVFVADFFVKNKKIPQNGLVAHYELSRSLSYVKILKPLPVKTYITYLDNEYNKGSNFFVLDPDHRPAVVLSSLQYIAKNAFSGAGLAINYDVLPDTLCGRTLDVCSYAELLQQIAIASGTTVNYTVGKRRGFQLMYNDIQFKKIAKDNSDFVALIDTNIEYKYPEFESIDIKDLEINVYKNDKKYKNEERTAVDRTYIEFILSNTTDDYTYGTFPLNNDEVLSLWADAMEFDDLRWNFYGNYVEIRSYDKHIRINGGYTVMDTTSEKIVSNLKDEGNAISVDNVLITINQYNDASAYLATWLTDVKMISVECRIDPSLELFDKVWIKDKSGKYNACVLEYVEINFNGAFKGKVEGRCFGEVYFIIPPTLKILNLTSWEGYKFEITNLNNFDCDLVVRYSSDFEQNFALPANSTLIIDQNTRDNFLGSCVEDYLSRGLDYDVYCFFENQAGHISETTLILEANG